VLSPIVVRSAGEFPPSGAILLNAVRGWSSDLDPQLIERAGKRERRASITGFSGAPEQKPRRR
jgi:hypothetical protein